MRRSYRALGVVALMVFVVAPLSLFAVLALLEDDADESIELSLDGLSWAAELDGALLASPESWTPGQVRSAIVYVRNDGSDPVDAEVSVTASSTEDLVAEGYLSLGATVDQGSAVSFPEATETSDLVVGTLDGGDSVPVTLTATFAETAPIGATLDSEALRVRLEVEGARSGEPGAPSLLDAAGAQLWLAPVLLVLGAVVALLVQARRRPTSGHRRAE